jgi:universal stress protein A
VKIRAAPKSRVVVELAPGDAEFPPVALAELKLNRILVPVDFSEPSRKALHYAVYFARQFNAEVLLLHVVELLPPPPYYLLADSSSLDIKLREEAVKRLSQWRKEIVSQAPAKATVRSGTAWQEIIRAADESNVDLIIMGTYGRTGLAHFFLGSTAERVVREAPCPAMVVREREHDFLAESGRKSLATTEPAAPVNRRFPPIKKHENKKSS